MVATPTLPFPTTCSSCRRMYTAFKTRWGRWHASVFPDNVPKEPSETLTIRIPPEIEYLAKNISKLAVSQCRTEKPAKLADVVKGLKIQVESLETHGGMGRIYTLTDPSKILKIADVQRSWCTYEPRNYATMERLGIPCAKVYVAETRPLGSHVYMVFVLERLEFTMTAYIRAAARFKASPKHVIGVVQGILDMLKDRNVVYGDLSPDNIMFRMVEHDMFTVTLIDPQFMVPMDAFRKVMPRKNAESFDTTYVALKIQALGMTDHAVQKFTEIVCAGLLGHVPLEKHTTRWLMHEAPVGLFMAYDILRQT